MDFRIGGIRQFFLKDKRKSDRLFLPIKIFYSLSLDAPWIGPVFVEDIGGYGLRFANDTKLSEKTELILKIVFPGDNNKPITLSGEVLWCGKEDEQQSDFSVGVKFEKMNYEDRRRYIKYISEEILLNNFKKLK